MIIVRSIERIARQFIVIEEVTTINNHNNRSKVIEVGFGHITRKKV